MNSNTKPNRRPVTRSVPQGSIWGPILFNLFTDDVEDGTAPSASLQMIQLRGVVDMPDDCAAVQRDRHWLAEWAGKTLVRNSVLGCFRKNIASRLRVMMGRSKEEGATMFSVVPSDRTGCNGHTLKYKKFCSYIRKQCLTVREIELWVVESPSLEMLKTQLNVVALSSLL